MNGDLSQYAEPSLFLVFAGDTLQGRPAHESLDYLADTVSLFRKSIAIGWIAPLSPDELGEAREGEACFVAPPLLLVF